MGASSAALKTQTLRVMLGHQRDFPNTPSVTNENSLVQLLAGSVFVMAVVEALIKLN